MKNRGTSCVNFNKVIFLDNYPLYSGFLMYSLKFCKTLPSSSLWFFPNSQSNFMYLCIYVLILHSSSWGYSSLVFFAGSYSLLEPQNLGLLQELLISPILLSTFSFYMTLNISMLLTPECISRLNPPALDSYTSNRPPDGFTGVSHEAFKCKDSKRTFS